MSFMDSIVNKDECEQIQDYIGLLGGQEMIPR